MTLPNVCSRQDVCAAIDELPVALPLSVAMTDLDGFGVFNEEIGRDTGNQLLAGFHTTLTKNLPNDAIVVPHLGQKLTLSPCRLGSQRARRMGQPVMNSSELPMKPSVAASETAEIESESMSKIRWS